LTSTRICVILYSYIMRIVFYVQRGLFGIQDSIIKAILGNLARVVTSL
jgi:hypothetical protein